MEGGFHLSPSPLASSSGNNYLNFIIQIYICISHEPKKSNIWKVDTTNTIIIVGEI